MCVCIYIDKLVIVVECDEDCLDLKRKRKRKRKKKKRGNEMNNMMK